jgi:hypothetical protein
LRILAEQIDEIVAIGAEAGGDCIDVLIDGVDFLGDFALLEEEGSFMFLGDEDDTLCGNYAYGLEV